MEIMELEFNVDVEVMTNSDSIIPSRQRRVDIKWERNIKAAMLIVTKRTQSRLQPWKEWALQSSPRMC